MTSCIQIQMFDTKALVFAFPVFEEMNTVCSQILFTFLENKMAHKPIHIS